MRSFFIGPRAAMITPWSTNAVEITQNMGVVGIIRIEEFYSVTENFTDFDPMLSHKYSSLHQTMFNIDIEPEQFEKLMILNAIIKKKVLL